MQTMPCQGGLELDMEDTLLLTADVLVSRRRMLFLRLPMVLLRCRAGWHAGA